MNITTKLNEWAKAQNLTLKAEAGTTGKGGAIAAVVVTCDAQAVGALIKSEWPIDVSSLAPAGVSILKAIPGGSGLFRFKLPEAKFRAEEEMDVDTLLSGAKLLGSSGPSTGECNWCYPQFANANNTGVYGPCVLQAFDTFRSLWTIAVEETVITLFEIVAEDAPKEFVPRTYAFDALKQDDSGKSGSTDGFTSTHVFKILNGLLLEFCKTGVPSKTGRGGTTS